MENFEFSRDSFNFYRYIFHGDSIQDAAEWEKYRSSAEDQMKRYKRIYTVEQPEENAEAMAICAMAEALYGFDLIVNGEGGAVQSASIGSVSIGYGSNAAGAVDLSPRGRARELYRCAQQYLNIYRGVR